jgi:hypothetical protein
MFKILAKGYEGPEEKSIPINIQHQKLLGKCLQHPLFYELHFFSYFGVDKL